MVSVSLICDGFIGQGKNTASGLGLSQLAVARIPGHVDGQSAVELASGIVATTVPALIEALTREPDQDFTESQPSAGDIVSEGTFDEINAHFYEQRWSDGLPIVPPTRDRVEAFIAHTDLAPEHRIGVLMPAGCAATVHNVAVNAVMANCRPEYMPVLIAIAQVLANPRYGVEHSGDTTGGDALIVLSGPAVSALGFNVAEAALRDGYQANTSVGRFLRLYLRNVAGCLPGDADKSTFGHTWRVVLAENAGAAAQFDWPTLGQDVGYAATDSVVTIARFTSGGTIGSIYGDDPEQIASYLADGLVRHSSWELVFTVGFAPDTYRPLLVLSPMVVRTLSRAGWTKARLRERLFQLARIPARKMEQYIGPYSNLVPGQ
ncbi:MAG: hypothetical protein K0U93_27550, partial [Gammaproteobacteria bacterium]|nr:hypothetical protein [Gammaproteobacteria bacterium]